MKLRAPSLLLSACSFLFAATSLPAADPGPAATATNEVGVDLYRKLATGEDNLCLSPYSIKNALAMTFAGADGQTRPDSSSSGLNHTGFIVSFNTTRTTSRTFQFGT
jgi:serine protease inhibitor